MNSWVLESLAKFKTLPPRLGLHRGCPPGPKSPSLESPPRLAHQYNGFQFGQRESDGRAIIPTPTPTQARERTMFTMCFLCTDSTLEPSPLLPR